jgi:two-component system NtrC family sensor kinase
LTGKHFSGLNQMNRNVEIARILVVDDNPAIHDDFRKVFQSTAITREMGDLDALFFGDTASPASAYSALEYKQSDAFQGEEALAMLQQASEEDEPFDMAFVDMRMPPGWDGLETIKKLWEHDPDLQIVVCTAFSDYSWSDFFAELGAQDGLLILKKPFDQAEVLQLACALTKKRRLIRLSNINTAAMEKTVKERTLKLQEAHQESERVLSAISSLLIGVDAKGTINRWNETASNVFGIAAEAALGEKLTQLDIQWANPNSITEMLSPNSSNTIQVREIVFENQHGESRTIGSSFYTVFNEGEWDGHLILGGDITNEKNLGIQLQQSQKMESVGQLAAGVAHEINTPMQYIGDNVRYVSKTFDRLLPILELLPAIAAGDVTDKQLADIQTALNETVKLSKFKTWLEQIPEALGDSIEGVEAVSKIVAAMKEFSHPGSDQKCHVSMNQVLDSTITVAKNEWKYVADIETDYEEDLNLIDGLRAELNQAFLNIVMNAAHAIGDRVEAGDYSKGKIKLTTRSAEDGIEVSIQDNGGGIPESARDRVFDPFFTTKAVGKGTGQGLSIAYSVIAKQHGGQLRFEVEEGVGTTFLIKIPTIC